jgi:heme-degrading monooxygenase HmoA
MFVLHIDLELKAGAQEALKTAFRDTFRPAISAQDGFLAAELLQPLDSASAYCLELAFDQQATQQQWVATDLHQQVWPAIAGYCTNFAVKSYNTI